MLKIIIIFALIQIFILLVGFFLYRAILVKYMAKYIYKNMANSMLELSNFLEENMKTLDIKEEEIRELLKEVRYQTKKLRAMVELVKPGQK